MASDALRIFLIAGEPSGDALGAGLISALIEHSDGIQYRGIGGPLMANAGLDLVFPYDDLAIMGLVEVLPRYFRIRRRWRETIAAIRAFGPDVVVTIDASGFNKPIARRLIKEGLNSRRVHYVAPMVWAWRPGRAQKMASLFHHLLVLFPFELPYFAPHGMTTTCVGHPAAERAEGDGSGFRRHHGIPANAQVLGVLPGSRCSEVERLLPTMIPALHEISQHLPNLVLVFPTLPLVANKVREAAASLPLKTIIIDDPSAKQDAFAATDVAMAASGTVTLELALARVPLISTYQMHPVTAAIGRRLLKVTSVCLPNLLAGEDFVPEFLQEYGRSEVLARETLNLLQDPVKRAAQQTGFAKVRDALTVSGGSPSDIAAGIILSEAALRRAT
jgi:lipid-A-disaccharide synthase